MQGGAVEVLRTVSSVGVLQTGPNVHCELPQCIISVRMWSGDYNLGLSSS
jgi:hypothetical protein